MPDTEQADETAGIQRITLIVLGSCLFLLVWSLIADRYTPYTSAARVTGYIIPIAPQVAGNVTEVPVAVNQLVKAGDTLLSINASDYQLAVDKAQADLEQATQNIGASVENLAVSEADLSKAITQRNYYQVESKRVFELEQRGVLSKSDGDKARAEVEKAKASVVAARAKLERSQQRLGAEGADNPQIRNALTALQDARLNLARTTIIAPSNGGVTSVSISPGNYAQAGKAIMTFVSSETAWIEAYMRENNLGNIKTGDSVEIVLDSAPGRIFHGEIASIGFAVSWENTAQAGQLQSVNAPRTWIRDAQRFPVIVRFADKSAKGLLRAGGQADVIVYTSGNWITNSLAWVWIRTVSILSYAY
jgi:multidrug resistance efflux pump